MEITGKPEESLIYLTKSIRFWSDTDFGVVQLGPGPKPKLWTKAEHQTKDYSTLNFVNKKYFFQRKNHSF